MHPPSALGRALGLAVAIGLPALLMVQTSHRHVSLAQVPWRQSAVGETRRISIGTAGQQAESDAWAPSVSADGLFVAWHSDAANLVEGDDNLTADVFMRDLTGGSTVRITRAHNGRPTKAPSGFADLSADGALAVFTSEDESLVPDDGNYKDDVFVHDRTTGLNERVSVTSEGRQPDGPIGGEGASISGDGRLVAFGSASTNLVPGDTNEARDIFVRDRRARTSFRVSVPPGGGQFNANAFEPALSADGEHVAFVAEVGGAGGQPVRHVFVHDLRSGVTRLATTGPGGQPANASSSWPGLSHDGSYVVFSSLATNLVADDANGVEDVFVRDMQTGLTTRISVSSEGGQANGRSSSPRISGDGRAVVFVSAATNLVGQDTNRVDDVFVHDLRSRITMRVSVASSGAQSDGQSYAPDISADARVIVYVSRADNLDVGDTNHAADVFLYEWAPIEGATWTPAPTATSTPPPTPSANPTDLPPGRTATAEATLWTPTLSPTVTRTSPAPLPTAGPHAAYLPLSVKRMLVALSARAALPRDH